MIEWYKKALLENYANFNGRARRSEYWYFSLMNVLIIMLIVIIGLVVTVGSGSEGGIFSLGIFWVLYMLYALGTFIPSIAVLVRRLHDVGKSGWFYFIAFVPIIGGIWLLVLLFTEGDAGPNEYGPDPKNEFQEMNEIGSEFKY